MPTLIGISGSLRRGSLNTLLLRAAAEATPSGTTLTVVTLHGIPLYDGDLEAESGPPEAVTRLKEQLAGSAGFLLVTPEYNNSIPGVLKNAVDWLSRPGADMPRVFGGKPVALMGASPGPAGTLLSQTAWLPVLRTLGTVPWFGGRMMVGKASEVFDGDGKIKDTAVRGQLEKFVSGFAQFAERLQGGR